MAFARGEERHNEGMEQKITTIEELMPHLRADMTARELGAVVIALVPTATVKRSPHYQLRQRLALAARDRLEREWSDLTVQHWLRPSYQSDAHLHRHLVISRSWKEKNRDRTRAASNRWKAENQERNRDYKLRWYEENAERERERCRRWNTKNRHHRSEHMRHKRATEPSFRLAGNLRNRVREALALNGQSKSARTMELIGCSAAELRDHLEQQFQLGMSWSNYGAWEIDHRIPCQAFDLSDPEQQRACFHWSNLQPLWKAENRSKGNLWQGKRWSRGVPSGARAEATSPSA